MSPAPTRMPLDAPLVIATSADGPVEGATGDPPSLQAIAQPRVSANAAATSGVERSGPFGAEELMPEARTSDDESANLRRGMSKGTG